MDNRLFLEMDIKFIHLAKFLFHGAYYKGQGVAEVGISLLCLVYYLVGWKTGIVWLDIIMLIFGLFFPVIYPLYLLGKAGVMVFASRKNKSTTKYVFTDRCIKMSQDREEADMEIVWGDVFFVHETKSMIFIYLTPKIALMFPKEQLKNDEANLKDFINRNMDARRVKYLGKK